MYLKISIHDCRFFYSFFTPMGEFIVKDFQMSIPLFVDFAQGIYFSSRNNQEPERPVLSYFKALFQRTSVLIVCSYCTVCIQMQRTK